jgi:hypothetical protein
VEQKIFGLPGWVALVTLGAAGIVGYVIFIKNSTPSSSSGGGATGYSAQGLAVMQNPDESATMALQNQLLSQIGLNMQTGFGDVQNSFTELGGNMASGFSTIGTSLAGLSGQISGLSGQITGLQSSQDANAQTILTTMQQWGNALSSQMTQEQQTLVAGQQAIIQRDIANGVGIDQLRQDMQTMQGTLGTISQQQQQTGAFLGWQFYQIPNRYTAYIPGGLNPPGWNG